MKSKVPQSGPSVDTPNGERDESQPIMLLICLWILAPLAALVTGMKDLWTTKNCVKKKKKLEESLILKGITSE
ncbi:hypothetical protein IHE45_07G042500 [Dioscorea alata]|uniref:Uncharacterized protein n=1 Tax=Dioscorea alata TaxID=55571 RepID=A0ACB7VQS2_DIOAL|nr:hypothetical protein IHE45_07G042500 [Dioscorea alata]